MIGVGSAAADISVMWYSIVPLTSLANEFQAFAHSFFARSGRIRQLAGREQSVSEWFPKRERGLAAALYDSGSSVGGAVAPFLILPVYLRWGWRIAFVIPGLLGFFWLIVWRQMYHLPRGSSAH